MNHTAVRNKRLIIKNLATMSILIIENDCLNNTKKTLGYTHHIRRRSKIFFAYSKDSLDLTIYNVHGRDVGRYGK